MTYLHELKNWPALTWDQKKLANKLISVRHRQGRLVGRMEGLGFTLRKEAFLQTLTQDIVKSGEIEGETLNQDQVRSSVARRLGMDIAGLVPADRNVEGVVEMMLDATQHYDKPLTKARLFDWHASLFPTGRSGMFKIIVGDWRDDKNGPMQVVSGPMGQEKIHYQAPGAKRVPGEMRAFLKWYEAKDDIDLVLKAGLAHLWFASIHPFEDGNGRIARTIADMTLARSEKSAQRFYSMSAQIRQERNAYYDILERTQKNGTDVTPWLEWFLDCLDKATGSAETALANVLRKARFWETHANDSFNDRQRAMINRLFDGFFGKLTSSKWAKISKCSQDTAFRDIDNLVKRGILEKEAAGGRSTSYCLSPSSGT